MMARMMSLPVTPAAIAVDAAPHVLGLLLDQRLRGEHMLDLRGADAVRQRTECAMRRGVAVAADDGHAGSVKPCSGPMTWTTPWRRRARVVIFDAEFRVVASVSTCAAARDWDRLETVGGRHVVVDDGERFSGARTLGPPCAGPRRPAGRRHLVHEMAVDVERRVPSGWTSTTWSSQILSARGLRHDLLASRRAPSRTGEQHAFLDDERQAARPSNSQRSPAGRSSNHAGVVVAGASATTAG